MGHTNETASSALKKKKIIFQLIERGIDLIRIDSQYYAPDEILEMINLAKKYNKTHLEIVIDGFKSLINDDTEYLNLIQLNDYSKSIFIFHNIDTIGDRYIEKLFANRKVRCHVHIDEVFDKQSKEIDIINVIQNM